VEINLFLKTFEGQSAFSGIFSELIFGCKFTKKVSITIIFPRLETQSDFATRDESICCEAGNLAVICMNMKHKHTTTAGKEEHKNLNNFLLLSSGGYNKKRWRSDGGGRRFCVENYNM
jgi:hypothetical protein